VAFANISIKHIVRHATNRMAASRIHPLMFYAELTASSSSTGCRAGWRQLLWVTIDSTAVVTANSASALVPANNPEYFAVTPGQVLNFISTSKSTGYFVLTEMT
jgi:hypothetical protein